MRPPGTLSLLWHWRGAALRFLGVTAAVGVALFAVTLALDAPMAPWMRSFGLWPTLTGQWRGTMVGATERVWPEVLHGEWNGDEIRAAARPAVRLTLRRGGEAEFVADCGSNVVRSRPRPSR